MTLLPKYWPALVVLGACLVISQAGAVPVSSAQEPAEAKKS